MKKVQDSIKEIFDEMNQKEMLRVGSPQPEAQQALLSLFSTMIEEVIGKYDKADFSKKGGEEYIYRIRNKVRSEQRANLKERVG